MEDGLISIGLLVIQGVQLLLGNTKACIDQPLSTLEAPLLSLARSDIGRRLLRLCIVWLTTLRLLIPGNTCRFLQSLPVLAAEWIIVHHFLKVLLLLFNPFEAFSSLFGSRGFNSCDSSNSTSIHDQWVYIIVGRCTCMVDRGCWRIKGSELGWHRLDELSSSVGQVVAGLATERVSWTAIMKLVWIIKGLLIRHAALSTSRVLHDTASCPLLIEMHRTASSQQIAISPKSLSLALIILKSLRILSIILSLIIIFKSAEANIPKYRSATILITW